MWTYSLVDEVALSAFRFLAGKGAADRLAVVADWHYPTGHPQTQRPRRARLYLRSLFYARSTARWLDFLWSDPARRQAARRNRDLVEKIHRPYLRKDLDSGGRLALLESHYGFGARQPHGALLVAATLDDVLLAELGGKTGKAFGLVLGPAGTLQKEGELRLRLECDGLALLSLAFTLATRADRPVLCVGCLQGSPDAAARDATKDLFGLRPRQLLLVALQAIARAYGASAIVGVDDRLHIYRHWRKRRAIMQSYDEMWLDLGGVPQPEGMFELPLEYRARPLSEYPSNKRSAMARRQALEQQLIERIVRAIGAQPGA